MNTSVIGSDFRPIIFSITFQSSKGIYFPDRGKLNYYGGLKKLILKFKSSIKAMALRLTPKQAQSLKNIGPFQLWFMMKCGLKGQGGIMGLVSFGMILFSRFCSG